MKIQLLLLFFFLGTFFSNAQITPTPIFPIDTKSVVIRFNSAEDSKLKTFTGDLYAHTGVIVDGKTDWQHVIGTWANNTIQPKLTNLGGGIYELNITPSINQFYSVKSNERVTQIAFVFRSSDGKQQTNDLLISVYQAGLILTLQAPENREIIEQSSNYTIKAETSEAAKLTLKINNQVVQTNTGTTIQYETPFNTPGKSTVVAIAETSTETKTDTAYIYVRTTNPTNALPPGYKKGITYLSDTSVRLVLWAPKKSFVYILGDFNDWTIDNQYLMNQYGDYFWIEINNLEKGKPYAFQYFIDGKRKIADPYTEVISDPWNDSYITSTTYPDLMNYPEGKTEGITSVLQTGQTPYKWQVENFTVPDKAKMVIYELHIRDFDTERSYKAVRQRLDYLQDLNINVLELMPINEFEGNSSWGYNPSFYFAPDKAYGPKEELKMLIDECHKRDIAVVIDMVLNHSYGQSPFAQMYMDENWTITSDNPWYNVQSNFKNSSLSWGYDFNHDSPATKELVDSINSFWLKEYKVDGFRFDFTKGFSNTPYSASSWGSEYDAARISNLERMADEIWKRNSKALVICEHLADNSEEKVLSNYGLMLWGNMNYNYNEGAMGYTENNKSDLSWSLYTQRGWNQPNLVAYMESHDEERLMYKNISYGASQGTYNTKLTNTALDRIELASLFFIPLPGPKMIWQFGELGYDISIDYNGRVGEKPIKWGYTSDTNRTDLFRVMSKLNYLKQNYEEFSPTTITHNLKGETKWYIMSKNENHIVAVGNFGITQKTVTVTFPKTGKWFNYFKKEQINIPNATTEITLAPGEYRLYTSRELEHPSIKTTIEKTKLESAKVKVYPNPAGNFIQLEAANAVAFEIYSTTGQKITSRMIIEPDTPIDISQLQKGVYLLKIEMQDEQVYSQVFLKK